MPRNLVRPYMAGGMAFQHLSGVTQITEILPLGNRTSSNDPAELRKRSNTGYVLGGGVEVRAPFLRIAPKFGLRVGGQRTSATPSAEDSSCGRTAIKRKY